MTLVIAVQYPFGRFREALESQSKIRPLQRQEAIIFLTDSRWTYPDNRYEDNGMKLQDIDNSTVLAYSGQVNLAAQCVRNLRTRIERSGNKAVNVNDIFRRTYSHHKRYNDKHDIKTDRLSFLMGKYLKTRETKLILLESPDFKHKFVAGIEGVGDRCAYEEVRKVVVPKLNGMAYTGTEKDYITIAANVADAMRVLVIEKEHFKTVGGRIQFWVLDNRGINEYSLCYTTDPAGKAGWNRATISRSELKTAEDRLNLGPDYLIK
jgi:hypothetical protein